MLQLEFLLRKCQYLPRRKQLGYISCDLSQADMTPVTHNFRGPTTNQLSDQIEAYGMKNYTQKIELIVVNHQVSLLELEGGTSFVFTLTKQM